MGLGSCRSLLTDDTYLPDFDVRGLIGDHLPLFANLGIAQIEQLIEKNQSNLIDNLIDKLRADGLIVHVNPMQEWLQPEGDRFKNSPLETLNRLIDLKPNLSIIVKEVGQGMGPESLRSLLKLPIAALDFAAAGGTSFSMLELLRSEKTFMDAYKPLASIGHSAEEMVDFVNQILKEENDLLCKEIIISGGIQSFVDGHYLINKINTPAIYGQASAFLKHARGNYDELQRFISLEVEGLELAKRFFKIRTVAG
jgi:isopentenyl-diphosphate delta-isomerase